MSKRKFQKDPNRVKRPMGRPLKQIDWELAKDLAMAGCNGKEISSHFDINYNTFMERCQQDLNLTFTEFSDKYGKKGCSLIRAQQFAKALGHTEKGDNSLLIWLGKCRLKQEEYKKQNMESQNDNIFDRVDKEIDSNGNDDKLEATDAAD